MQYLTSALRGAQNPGRVHSSSSVHWVASVQGSFSNEPVKKRTHVASSGQVSKSQPWIVQ
jgi:hypothetical protein